MAFVRCAPPRPYNGTPHLAYTTAKPPFRRPVRSSAQTPISPPRSGSPPFTPNFFLNTSLSRTSTSTFPNDIDALLPFLSESDRIIPLWNEKALVTRVPSNDEAAPSPALKSSTLTLVLWTPAQLGAWLQQARRTLRPDLSPLALALSQSTSRTSLTNYFAVDVSHSPSAPTTRPETALPLRAALPLLEIETEAALLAHATALLSWHLSATFCSRCGHRTCVTRSGAARACRNPACATRNIYPRVMPSVLVLVLRNAGTEVLLGRKATWPARRYSVLAGFAELFESLEDTVAREVLEETGVAVDPTTIAYHSSQPWPSSPHASLMSGFRAHVTDPRHAQIRVDEDELEDARWFSRDWLRENLDNGAGDSASVSIPGHTSLACRLILEWLEESNSSDDGTRLSNS